MGAPAIHWRYGNLLPTLVVRYKGNAFPCFQVTRPSSQLPAPRSLLLFGRTHSPWTCSVLVPRPLPVRLRQPHPSSYLPDIKPASESAIPLRPDCPLLLLLLLLLLRLLFRLLLLLLFRLITLPNASPLSPHGFLPVAPITVHRSQRKGPDEDSGSPEHPQSWRNNEKGIRTRHQEWGAKCIFRSSS